MWAEVDQILRQATDRIVGDFLPSALVTLLLIVAAVVIAVAVRMILARMLRGLEFDRWAERLDLPGAAGWSSAMSPSQAVARFAFWVVLVLGLLVSLTALNASIPSMLALSVFEYLPHLLAALLILIAGVVVARFLARSVLIGAVNQQMQSARFLSLAVKWLVLLIAVAMALDHLGIGRSILLLAFGIFFGGVVLAGSLAVGLGARDVVSRTLERQFYGSTRSGVDKIDHV